MSVKSGEAPRITKDEFVSKYARVLSLDIQEAWNLYKKEMVPQPKKSKKADNDSDKGSEKETE